MRSKRTSAVVASLLMEDLSSSPPKFDYEPPKRSKKVKNLPLAPFVPKPTPKPRKKKVREPDFVVHQDSESEEEVNERILALEAWIDDDEMDRIRPNARTSCHLDSSDEEKAAIVSPSKRRRKGKGVKQGRTSRSSKTNKKATQLFVSSSRDISRSAASSRFAASLLQMGKEENSDCDDNDEDMSSQFQLEMKDDIDDVESKDSFYDKPALGPFERDMVQANRARARAKMTPKTTMKLEFSSPRSSKSKRKKSPQPPVNTSLVTMRRVHGSRSGVRVKSGLAKAQDAADSSFDFDEEDAKGSARNNVNLSDGDTSSSDDDYDDHRRSTRRR